MRISVLVNIDDMGYISYRLSTKY